jgi:flagellar motor switch protein FliN
MNEAASKEMTAEVKRWLEVWKTSLQDVLSQVAGRTISLTTSDEGLPSLADDLWYTVTSGGAVTGEMSLRFSAASGAILAQLLSGEAQPTAGEMTAERKDALDEPLRQISGQAATALTSPGGEVQLHVAVSSAPTWAPALSASFQTEAGAAPSFAAELQMSAALLGALSPQVRAVPVPPSAPEPLPANYERMMDVELEVKLCFGARRMELREVLALSPGAVVELDRTLQAPIDLLLDGRVIALGEVVVVDGKYGLRVIEVLKPGSAA